MNECKYPCCQNNATHTFGLVDLCKMHYDLIMDETKIYYSREISYDQRKHYSKISSYIPWSKENMDPWKNEKVAERGDFNCVS